MFVFLAFVPISYFKLVFAESYHGLYIVESFLKTYFDTQYVPLVSFIFGSTGLYFTNNRFESLRLCFTMFKINDLSTIMLIIFWKTKCDSNKNGIFQLPHKLPNNLRLRELRKEMSNRLVLSLLPKLKILLILVKSSWKIKFELFL